MAELDPDSYNQVSAILGESEPRRNGQLRIATAVVLRRVSG